jgi:hypothetical protein
MCKCRWCDCWYCNWCKTFVGQGLFCCWCAYICYNPRTNMMTPKCVCSSCTCFCGRWLGFGWVSLGLSEVCCAPVEFDDPFAEMKLDELTNQLRVGSVKRDAAIITTTEQRLYNY